MTDDTKDPILTKPEDDSIHILITQCLQNGFFLSDSNRLSLPEDVVRQMLIGEQNRKGFNRRNIKHTRNILSVKLHPKKFLLSKDNANKRLLNEFELRNGPLYRFFETVVTKKDRNRNLHVIHVKDWHSLSENYDKERRLYGAHCEADTWEAEPIDGYEDFLEPWGNNREAATSIDGYEYSKKVRFYEVLSDSVFDFKRSENIKYHETVTEHLKKNGDTWGTDSHLSVLLNQIIGKENEGKAKKKKVYLVVIGVYTDIKIQLLLTGLRSYYDIDNLIVSDTLTTSQTLERHLQGLDFIDKVLNVEVVSDLNSVVSILDAEKRDTKGQSSEEKAIPSSLTQNSIRWRDYRNYYLDKQTVLAFQDERLAQYMRLTTQRSLDLYEQIFKLNKNLQTLGLVAIILLLILVMIDSSSAEIEIPWQIYAATGLASVAQVVSLFITDTQDRMRENLGSLVRLRNYLETYSMTSAILRHHLTMPENLQEKDIDKVTKQLTLISAAAGGLRQNFLDITGKKDEPDKKDIPPPTSAG